MNNDYRLARERMVKNQLMPRGITDKKVLEAMGKVQRHLFMEEALVGEAYKDHPLPIGHKQTISQPFIVAQMTQALGLTGREKVLEIGTGSGYQTAILSELSSKVCTIERIRPLMERARYILNELGYANILFKSYDGTLGWDEWAPYDAIIITAGAPSVPEPLLGQLADGGRMVVPVGNKAGQDLIKITRKKDVYDKKSLGGCRFVDLIGAHGWKE
jgi:protein-L-isoaspartate(D-aspartate) O-methyltransferase